MYVCNYQNIYTWNTTETCIRQNDECALEIKSKKVTKTDEDYIHNE